MLDNRTILVEFSTSSEDFKSSSYRNIITTRINDRQSDTSFFEMRDLDGKFLRSFHTNKFTGQLNGLASFTDGPLIHERDYIDDELDGYAATYRNGKIVDLARYENGIDLGITVIPALDTIDANVKPDTVLSSIKRQIVAGILTL